MNTFTMCLNNSKIHHATLLILLLFLIGTNIAAAQWLLIPMDIGAQTNHLKAYGLTYLGIGGPTGSTVATGG